LFQFFDCAPHYCVCDEGRATRLIPVPVGLMKTKHSPLFAIVFCLGMISSVWRVRIAAPLRPGFRQSPSSYSVARRCFAELFGKDQFVPAVGLSGYAAMEQQQRANVLQTLDEELQEKSVASLAFADLNRVAEDALAELRQDFADRVSNMEESEWSGSGAGWLWPQSAEMYSHPHYLAFVNDDGTVTPSDAPSGMQRLIDGIALEAVPVLEDLLGLGMDLAGSFAGRLRMRKVIVHYYPTPTAQDTLLTHAAFHCDDSFLTLNFENPPAMHGLQEGNDGAPEIRRLCHSGLGSSNGPVNLFVGGYLQSLSEGRWSSFIHSGSNTGPGDRISITIFLTIPCVDAYASRCYGGTRAQQEGAVHSLLQEIEYGDEPSNAAARFAEIRSMYCIRGKLPRPYGGGPCDELAVSRCYAVVGSWSDWTTFDTLLREDSGNQSSLSTPLYHASISIPAGEPVEFQLLCNEDWRQRIYPSKVAGELLGPTAEGHGNNFLLDAPDAPAVLNISWNPTGGGKLEYGFRAT